MLSILVLLAVVVTGSRGAVVSLCAGVIVLAVFAFPYFRKHVRCVGFLLVAGISFLFLTEFYVAGGEGGAGQRVADTVAGRIPVLWQRPAIWNSAWQIIREHFWTGTGIGTFFLYYPEVRGGDPYSAGRMA
ncbi:MAG: O-antigen ligase family protein, partial [Alphaproteobacteria bacterium]